ncbi:DNA polymerase IV [Mucilaginibacter terrae]|uniref:DNA polymerase IV n=1 Tax=Mucilaginibacter terrae TaxID=1955052 RepID=UPI0036300CFA
MERKIVHLDMDSFFVSVEQLRDSRLKGIPLAVGGTGDRGIITTCSYEARAFGVRSGMSMKLAKKLCPQLLIIRGDFERYSMYSRMITEIIADNTPKYEKASIDEFYVDMSGMDTHFGCLKFSTELRHYIMNQTGLPVSFGLASNKLISKVATNDAKPNGQLEIEYGLEKDFLAPKPVEKLPMVGDQTAYALRKKGIETIKLLSEVPLPYMESMFGKNGIELSRRANGIDDSPIIQYSEQKSISTENTFEQDTIDMQFLHSELVRMTEKISFDLRSKGLLTGCITVKLRYTNFDTVTKQQTIAYTNSDHMLLPIAKELFAKLYDRRLLIRLLGIRFTHLVPGTYQINLFEDSHKVISLNNAMDNIKMRYGAGKITRAVTLLNR